MANPSKRTPWVVEVSPVGTDGWYVIGAYRDEAEAAMQVVLARKRIKDASDVRYRDWRKKDAA